MNRKNREPFFSLNRISLVSYKRGQFWPPVSLLTPCIGHFSLAFHPIHEGSKLTVADWRLQLASCIRALRGNTTTRRRVSRLQPIFVNPMGKNNFICHISPVVLVHCKKNCKFTGKFYGQQPYLMEI